MIPAVALPQSYHAVVKATQILNLDAFTFIPIGCWAGGWFNFYFQALAMTLPVITIFSLLVFGGILIKSKRQAFNTIAIAITYLVLPTITTTVFGIMSCDSFDDGRKLLRRDYDISCEDDARR